MPNISPVKHELRSFWDKGTETLGMDLCDIIAHQLRSALEEKTPFIKFEGLPVTTKNPGWLAAALVSCEILSTSSTHLSQPLKYVMIDIRDKIQDIVIASENDSLAEMLGVYEVLIVRIDKILAA